MKKFVVLCAIVLISKLSANCDLIDSYTVAVEYNTLLERECSSLFGGGGVYYGKIVEASESSPVSCDGIKRSDGYVLIYGCNTCTSKNVQERLKQDTIACTEQCRMTMNKCVYDGISNDWGGYYNTDQHPSCSLLKSTSLPGCSESSSSQDDESSSSKELSSSSEESSSSVEESSSSEDGEESSSSEENIESSSSEECYDPDSCEVDRTGVKCYRGTPELCGSMLYTVYRNRPAMLGDIRLHNNPVCMGNRIEFRANVPEVHYFPYSFLCEKENCRGRNSFEGYWTCSDENSPIEGCLPELFYNPGLLFYYDLIERKLFSFWGEVNFDEDSSITESQFDVAFFDIEEMLNSIAERGVWADRHDTSLRVPLSMIYPERKYYTFYDHVKACAYHYGYEWDEFGLLRKIEPSSSSSKGTLEISSSSEVMSSEAVSSSSENVSCSSNEVSSSSEGISSSSNIELSSSAYGEWLSSSSEKEFSLAGSSSSSEIIDGIFIPGPDQTYAPDQIFRGGLQNMEDGKCYSLNPERGAQYGWINTNAQDTWWWIEVDCESGEKTDVNRIGACSGFPLDRVPSNYMKACFAYKGSCYKCNSQRGSDCASSWLWRGTFVSSNIGWWYELVDCYSPDEKNDDSVCPENSALYKTISNNEDSVVEDEKKRQGDLLTYNYFDALGRSIKKKDSFGVKRVVFAKTLQNKNVSRATLEGSMGVKILLKTISGRVGAKTNVTFSYNAMCTNAEYIQLEVFIEMSTLKDDIDVSLEEDDIELLQHEQKHRRIYEEYGNKRWNVTTSVSRRTTKKNLCEMIKNDYWDSVETAFRTMLNLQNAWDDEDVNNVSHERINVNREVENLKREWQNSICE
ncbi:hypothetical protein [Fibrobacter sp.]|uniref:hypothetical protein n=1 Tax=Fibrobacter sp. TaxID=35828 RepID=UPI002633B99A|nr:hypothetical protein [Fibrobacter sp.]